MLVGYMRVSTDSDCQVLDLQRDALLSAGVDERHLFEDRASSSRNVLVTAIILWNTRYLEHAVAALPQAEEVPDHLLAHLSPLGWEHVNLTGDYIWAAHHSMSENLDGMRTLRLPPDTFAKAA